MIPTQLFFLIAFMLACGALISFSRAIWIVVTWIGETAEITRYITKSEQGEGTFFYPEFLIKSRNPPHNIIVSSWGSWRKPWKTGTEISILIHPDNDQRIEIKCFANLFGIPATLIGLAMGFWAFVHVTML